MSDEIDQSKNELLEKEIFGNSDEDEEDLNDFALSSDDDDEKEYNRFDVPVESSLNAKSGQEKVSLDDGDEYISKPLPSFKKKISRESKHDSLENDFISAAKKDEKQNKKKKSKKSRGSGDKGQPTDHGSADVAKNDEDDEANLNPEEAKLREARRDVEEALNKIKPKKAKRDLMEETDIDEMIQILIQKMNEAAQTDEQLNQLKQPAIAKLKLLPIVDEQLSKRHLGEQFLDNGVLEVIKVWLEPCRPDGLFPVLDIQKSMLKALASLSIHTLHLRESGVGKIVKFYSKYSDIPEIKKMATQLVDKWMRPIINRSDKYKDRKINVMEYDISENLRDINYQSNQQAQGNRGQQMSTAIQNRARIPATVAPSFDVAPKSILMGAGDRNKGADPYRKLKNRMMMMKRKAT